MKYEALVLYLMETIVTQIKEKENVKCDVWCWRIVSGWEIWRWVVSRLVHYFPICDLHLEFLQKLSIKGVKIAVWMTAGFALATLAETNSIQSTFGPQIFPRLDQPDTRVVVCVSPWIGLVPCVGVVCTRARVYLRTSQWYYHFLHFNFKLFQTRKYLQTREYLDTHTTWGEETSARILSHAHPLITSTAG